MLGELGLGKLGKQVYQVPVTMVTKRLTVTQSELVVNSSIGRQAREKLREPNHNTAPDWQRKTFVLINHITL